VLRVFAKLIGDYAHRFSNVEPLASRGERRKTTPHGFETQGDPLAKTGKTGESDAKSDAAEILLAALVDLWPLLEHSVRESLLATAQKSLPARR
jgi:hypothetical protein